VYVGNANQKPKETCADKLSVAKDLDIGAALQWCKVAHGSLLTDLTRPDPDLYAFTYQIRISH